MCSRITSRTSSRVWRGTFWGQSSLRADSAVWLSHTSSIWPWSGTPKVCLYGTFISGIQQPLCEFAISWSKQCPISAKLALAESGRKSSESALGTSFFLETIEWSKSWQKLSLYASRICFFSFVHLTIIASSRVLVSANTVSKSLVCWGLECSESFFDWRALKISASHAGCTFQLDWVDVAVDSTFIWAAFITKLLCNLLLIFCTKLFDVVSGQASFGGEGGAESNYWKIHSTIRHGRQIFGMPHTAHGCQKQIKPSYWWVCLYHPIELCTLALGQVASDYDICWISLILSNFRSSNEQG